MKLKFRNPFATLTKFEWCLWLSSVGVVVLSTLLSPERDLLSMTASLVGVTSLIFLAKGYVIGQLLMIAFSLFYGYISFFAQYYGEMITYLGMTMPLAILSTISWLRHPFKDTAEVAVSRVSRRSLSVVILLTLAVTVAFYFILGALNTANLIVSTISVATSFFAASLTFLRSPWYALGYVANDAVLITLWITATLADLSCLPMALCFCVFFVNDTYVFISWRRMEKRQMKMVENL